MELRTYNKVHYKSAIIVLNNSNVRYHHHIIIIQWFPSRANICHQSYPCNFLHTSFNIVNLHSLYLILLQYCILRVPCSLKCNLIVKLRIIRYFTLIFSFDIFLRRFHMTSSLFNGSQAEQAYVIILLLSCFYGTICSILNIRIIYYMKMTGQHHLLS